MCNRQFRLFVSQLGKACYIWVGNGREGYAARKEVARNVEAIVGGRAVRV